MRESSRFRLGLALVLAPIVGQLLVVFRLGVNTPVGDEFFYVDFIRALREGGRWLPMVWWQHNEHRVVPVKLVMALLEPFTGWSLKAEMYVSAILAGLVVLGLWRHYRLAGGTNLLLFAPVSWLYCNLAQYENMLYGLLMCHYFTAAGVVWAMVFLARRSNTGLVLAVLCGLIASLSILNGLLIWPVGLLLLLAWRERPARTVAWTLAGAGTFALYFLDFKPPAGLKAMHLGLGDVPRIAAYAVASLGAPLAAGSVAWGATVGLALVVLAAVIGFRWLPWLGKAGERLRDEALLAAPLLFGLLSCASIAGGRATTGVPPLESRYIAYSALAFAGAYLLASRAAERTGAPWASPWLAASLVLLMTGALAADLQGFRDASLWRLARLRDQFLLQTYDRQPDAALGDAAFVTRLRESQAPYLRAERLAAFAEPQHILLLTQWDERKSAGPILPGRPVELRLGCPVDVLRDLAVTLSREAPTDASNVSVSVWAGGRRLTVRELPVSALAGGWVGWVDVPLPEPLRNCQGRELIVRIESPDATPATQVTVWTYPSYYDAVARLGDGPLAPGRSPGLLLNAYYFGLQK
jgi:hypothetical protein